MIRVVLRHIDSADSVLLGDFAPSELPALKELVADARVYWADWAECAELDDEPYQFITTKDRGRMVLEILLAG